MDQAQEYQFIKRFSEPSSYAGLAAALTGAGLALPGWWSAATFVAAGICGILAFVLKDPGSPT